MLRDILSHIVLFVCFLILCLVVDANAASGTGRAVRFQQCLLIAFASYVCFWIAARALLLYFGLGSSVAFPPKLPFEEVLSAPKPAMVPATPAMPAMQAMQAPPAMPPAAMLQMPAAMPATQGPPMQPAAMHPLLQPQQMQPMKPESNFQGLFKMTKQKKPKALAKTNGQVHFCRKGQGGYEWGVDKNGLPCAKPGPKGLVGKKNSKKKARKKKQYKKMRSSD